MDLTFERAARIDDALVVHTCFNSVQGPRLFIRQEIRRGADRIAAAAVEACCVSLTGRPKRPPALLKQRLEPFLEP
jgi:acyl-CoA thioester hydrolase